MEGSSALCLLWYADGGLTCRQLFAVGLGHFLLSFHLCVTPVLITGGGGGPLPQRGGGVLAGGAGGLGGTPG